MSEKSQTPRDSSEQRLIEKEASEWVAKKDLGLSPSEQDQFFQWLSRDPRHREVFNCYQKNWDHFDLLAQWKPEHSSKANPNLLDYLRPQKRFQRIAVAAGLAVAIILAFLWIAKPEKWVPDGDLENLNILANTYQYHTLEDGSEVDLNAGTELQVTYSPGLRRVRLISGEAYFTVARDSDRPFVVTVDNIAVQAVGTEFNVKLIQKNSVEVLVTEGRVKIEANKHNLGNEDRPTPTHDLLPGDWSKLPLQSNIADKQLDHMPEAAIERYLTWKPKKLQFESVPLSEAVAQFNRYNDIQLILADPGLANRTISGSFRSVNVEGFARLLELTSDIPVHRNNSREIVLGLETAASNDI